MSLDDPLRDWWMAQAAAEADKLIPKAQEYGSFDLELTGRLLAEMVNPDRLPLADQDWQLMERGIVFYLAGKVARLVSAIRDGHTPSDDTFMDISIYARMALYIREHKQWP